MWKPLTTMVCWLVIWAPVKILYMWLVAIVIVIVIAFGGSLSLSRVLWISAYSRSNMKPKVNPKQARTCIEELFCWFQVLRQEFMFLSFCVHLHAFSSMFLSFACIFLSFCIHFPSFFLSFSSHVPFLHFSFIYSFRSHSNVHSCPFIFLSSSCEFACMFLSSCIHILWFPF